MELSSSSGNIGLISEKDFHNIKKSVYDSDSEVEKSHQIQPPKLNRTKSLTFSSSLTNLNVEEPKQSVTTERLKEVSASILTSSVLHVNAPEFKPRPRASTQPLSSSVPSNAGGYMNQNKSYRRAREQRGRRLPKVGRNVPRFYPAIVKDEVSDKVITFVCILYTSICFCLLEKVQCEWKQWYVRPISPLFYSRSQLSFEESKNMSVENYIFCNEAAMSFHRRKPNCLFASCRVQMELSGRNRRNENKSENIDQKNVFY